MKINRSHLFFKTPSATKPPRSAYTLLPEEGHTGREPRVSRQVPAPAPLLDRTALLQFWPEDTCSAPTWSQRASLASGAPGTLPRCPAHPSPSLSLPTDQGPKAICSSRPNPASAHSPPRPGTGAHPPSSPPLPTITRVMELPIPPTKWQAHVLPESLLLTPLVNNSGTWLVPKFFDDVKPWLPRSPQLQS